MPEQLSVHLEYVIITIPVLAFAIGLLFSPDMAERHHIHHDTYSISQVITRTLLLVMTFMGILGGVTGWLCHLGVFTSDPVVPLAFFVAFQLSIFVVFIALNRCRVMAYDDRMFVRPWFRRQREVPYGQIERMVRRPYPATPHFNDLLIYLKDGSRIRVSGLLDIEQMLLRIDRFDAMPS